MASDKPEEKVKNRFQSICCPGQIDDIEKAREKTAHTIRYARRRRKLPVDYDLVCDIFEGELFKSIIDLKKMKETERALSAAETAVNDKIPDDDIDDIDPEEFYAAKDIIDWRWVCVKYGWTYREIKNLALAYKNYEKDTTFTFKVDRKDDRLFRLLFDELPEAREAQREKMMFKCTDANWRRYRPDKWTVEAQRDTMQEGRTSEATTSVLKTLGFAVPTRERIAEYDFTPQDYPLPDESAENITPVAPVLQDPDPDVFVLKDKDNVAK